MRGVTLSVINPGFVDTSLTAQYYFNMPFLMQTPQAARLSIEVLLRRRFEMAYPLRFVIIMKLTCLLPYALFFRPIRTDVEQVADNAIPFITVFDSRRSLVSA